MSSVNLKGKIRKVFPGMPLSLSVMSVFLHIKETFFPFSFIFIEAHSSHVLNC